MKKFLATMLALVMALTLCATAWAEGGSKFVNNVAEVGTVSELHEAMKELETVISSETMTIELKNDIAFSDADTWEQIRFEGNRDGSRGGAYPLIVIDGKGFTISNMPEALITKLEFGQSITIQNLTLSNSTVTVPSNVTNDCAIGAFISESDSCAKTSEAGNSVKFINCKLVNANLTGNGGWTGGFVGYASGAGSILFKDCVVEGSTIVGNGSTGGLMGHAMGAVNMKVTVQSTSVINNTKIEATEKAEKVGALFGTVGNNENDIAEVSAIVYGNTVQSGETAVTTIYGRRGGDNGASLTLTGGSYDEQPLKGDDSAWAKVADDVTGAEVTVNGKTTYVYNADVIKDMANVPGTQIKVTNGTLKLGEMEYTKDSDPIVIPNVYTVTFDADDGTPVPAVQTVKDGEKATKPTDPTKDGYTFAGWFAEGAATAFDFENTTINSNITLKAHWTAQSSGGSSNRVHINPTTPTTETKAESPKTFDAGVAVYGLMAISSVLGMGYIGKKKF